MMRDLFREGRDVDAASVRSAENDAERRAPDVELGPPPSRSVGTSIVNSLLRFWRGVASIGPRSNRSHGRPLLR